MYKTAWQNQSFILMIVSPTVRHVVAVLVCSFQSYQQFWHILAKRPPNNCVATILRRRKKECFVTTIQHIEFCVEVQTEHKYVLSTPFWVHFRFPVLFYNEYSTWVNILKSCWTVCFHVISQLFETILLWCFT